MFLLSAIIVEIEFEFYLFGLFVRLLIFIISKHFIDYLTPLY